MIRPHYYVVSHPPVFKISMQAAGFFIFYQMLIIKLYLKPFYLYL